MKIEPSSLKAFGLFPPPVLDVFVLRIEERILSHLDFFLFI